MNISNKLVTIAENVVKVYNSGQRLMKDFFEKAFTNNFTRSYYAYAFMSQDWNNYTFSKTICPSGTIVNMFNAYKGKYLPKNIDLSRATSNQRLFYYATNLLEIDCMGMPALNNSEVFAGCSNLQKITGFNVNENITFDRNFVLCSSLQEIEIVGTIGNDISFSYSPLTKDCMNHIISCLKDFSETGDTHTLTFRADKENMLTAEEKTAATNKGWTLIWN